LKTGEEEQDVGLKKDSTPPATVEPIPPDSAAPPERYLHPFNPLNLNEPIAGFPAAEVRAVVAYHWDHSENDFWRKKTFSRKFFEKNFETMQGQVPVDFLRSYRPESRET
jgi:hypothetical protein